MKYVISFIILLSATTTWSYPIRIFHMDQPTNAQWVKDILQIDYQIPEALISLVNTSSCNLSHGSQKFDLCINSERELLIISVDRDFARDSLLIFRQSVL